MYCHEHQPIPLRRQPHNKKLSSLLTLLFPLYPPLQILCPLTLQLKQMIPLAHKSWNTAGMAGLPNSTSILPFDHIGKRETTSLL